MIERIKEYFLQNVDLAEEFNNILADFLDDETISYSIEPLPIDPILKRYSDGGYLGQYQFYFSSNEYYDNSVAQNIDNLGFYENFEKQIEYNNKNKILPDIKGIQSIECLSHGTVQDTTKSGLAKYAIQMRITYIKDYFDKEEISL